MNALHPHRWLRPRLAGTVLLAMTLLLAWQVGPAARARAQTPAPGTVLLADDFDDPNDPASGWLPKSSPDPAHKGLGYVGGEYMVQKVDPAWDLVPTAYLPGEYGDASLAIDARLVGPTAGRFIAVACRHQAASESEYRLSILPEWGSFLLGREDNGTWAAGASWGHRNWASAPAIRRGNQPNHLELKCAGDLITASVNGTQVGSLQDSTYRQGRMWIGAGTFSNPPGTAEARFDNIVVRAAGPPAR